MLPSCPTALSDDDGLHKVCILGAFLASSSPRSSECEGRLIPISCGPLLGFWSLRSVGSYRGVQQTRKGAEALDNRACTHAHKHLQATSELNSLQGIASGSAQQDSHLQQS